MTSRTRLQAVGGPCRDGAIVLSEVLDITVEAADDILDRLGELFYELVPMDTENEGLEAAARAGDALRIAKATRARIAKEMALKETSARDLAALGRRIMELNEEINLTEERQRQDGKSGSKSGGRGKGGKANDKSSGGGSGWNSSSV